MPSLVRVCCMEHHLCLQGALRAWMENSTQQASMLHFLKMTCVYFFYLFIYFCFLLFFSYTCSLWKNTGMLQLDLLSSLLSFWTNLLLSHDEKKCTKLRRHLCFQNKAGDTPGMLIKGDFVSWLIRIIKTQIHIAFPFFHFNIKVKGPRIPHS